MSNQDHCEKGDETPSVDGGIVAAGRGDAVFKKLNNIFHATQFSVRTPREAEAVIGALRRKSMEDPGGVAVTDPSHAYGSMSTQCPLEAVPIHCPQMLRILSTQ